MHKSDPNQALRRTIGVSTVLISGLIIIGAGITGPA